MSVQQPDRVRVRSALPGIGGRLVVLVALLALSAGAFVLTRVSPGASPQSDSVLAQDTFGKGLEALQRATIVVAPGAAASTVTDAGLAARSSALPTILGQYFTGEPLTRFTKTNQDALASQIQGGLRDIDGGVKQLSITSITVDSSGASGTARALVWIQGEATAGGEPGPAPEGWWDYKFHLVRTADGWRIDDLSFAPEPGSEP